MPPSIQLVCVRSFSASRPVARLLLLSLLAIAAVGAVTRQAAAAETANDLLAEGNLSQWRGYGHEDVPNGWKLDDAGVLTLDKSAPGAEGGDLITREKYRDFDFRFEWRIAEDGNSGVMYRVSEEPDSPSFVTGPEYQVLDNAGYADAEPRHLAGSIYGLYVPSYTLADSSARGMPKPAGEWNTGRVVIRNDRVEHWINEAVVATATLGSDDWNRRVASTKFKAWPKFGTNDAGHLCLQDHGDRVSYRNLIVERLQPSAAASPPARVLFVTQSAGFKHSTTTRKAHELSHSEQTLTRLGLESGDFRVDCTQDVAADFTPELLANYDVVAFYTTGDLPIPVETRDWFLNTWLAEQGHGFLGVHAAADTYAGYQPYWDMIGGTFDGHPWTSTTDVVLRVHDGSHPASQPWGAAGARVPITDEIYQFKNWQPEKVRVLMSLDMERTELKRPYHVPVLWVKPYGAGRVMHMSLGHREDVWDNPAYQQSLVGGVRWLLGREPGDATPNPALSAEEDALARAAFATPND